MASNYWCGLWSVPSVLAMRFVSVVSLVSVVADVSVVSLGERVSTPGRCSGVVFQSRMGHLMVHQGLLQALEVGGGIRRRGQMGLGVRDQGPGGLVRSILSLRSH